MNFMDDIKVLTGNKKPSPPSQKIASSKKTILVVEDEKPLANILETRLKEAGYTVLKAANGKEGLALATAHTPDLILLDLLMPVMNGKSMLHSLRKIPKFKNVPVIVLTNAGEVDNIRETQRYYDAVEFLIKSNVTLDQIVEKVKTIAW